MTLYGTCARQLNDRLVFGLKGSIFIISTFLPASGSFIKKSLFVLFLPIHFGRFLGFAQHLKCMVHEFLKLFELPAVR